MRFGTGDGEDDADYDENDADDNADADPGAAIAVRAAATGAAGFIDLPDAFAELLLVVTAGPFPQWHIILG